MSGPSGDENSETTGQRSLERRRVLQGIGAAGVGFVGSGTVVGTADDHERDAGEKRGTATFAASAVTHRIDFPSEEVRAASLVAVNTLPEHAIFEDDGILSYTHHTSAGTARVLEENPAGLWHDDYRALPASDVAATRRVWIGVDAIDHPRIVKGALIESSYRPPGFAMRQRGESVRVTVGSEQADVEPGERFRRELPARKLGIELSRPADGRNDDTEDGPPDGGEGGARGAGGRSRSIERLEVRPTLHVTNYGELELRAPEGWTPREREVPDKEDPKQ